MGRKKDNGGGKAQASLLGKLDKNGKRCVL